MEFAVGTILNGARQKGNIGGHFYISYNMAMRKEEEPKYVQKSVGEMLFGIKVREVKEVKQEEKPKKKERRISYLMFLEMTKNQQRKAAQAKEAKIPQRPKKGK
jgi:hypothetical protein